MSPTMSFQRCHQKPSSATRASASGHGCMVIESLEHAKATYERNDSARYKRPSLASPLGIFPNFLTKTACSTIFLLPRLFLDFTTASFTLLLILHFLFLLVAMDCSQTIDVDGLARLRLAQFSGEVERTSESSSHEVEDLERSSSSCSLTNFDQDSSQCSTSTSPDSQSSATASKLSSDEIPLDIMDAFCRDDLEASTEASQSVQKVDCSSPALSSSRDSTRAPTFKHELEDICQSLESAVTLNREHSQEVIDPKREQRPVQVADEGISTSNSKMANSNAREYPGQPATSSYLFDSGYYHNVSVRGRSTDRENVDIWLHC